MGGWIRLWFAWARCGVRRRGSLRRRPAARAAPLEGTAHEPPRWPASGLVPDHRRRRRRRDLARVRALASWVRGGFRQEEALSQRRLQRDHARRPLFPCRERLHPDLRPDAQRQSRAWLDLSAGRLFRLHDGRRDRLVALQLCRGFPHRCAARRPAAGRRLPPDGRTGPSSDAGHDRHFDRACRPDALGFRGKLLEIQTPVWLRGPMELPFVTAVKSSGEAVYLSYPSSVWPSSPPPS